MGPCLILAKATIPLFVAQKTLEDMDNNGTSTGNSSQAKSSGNGLTKLMLSRPWDSSKVTVDKTAVSNSTISSNTHESSSSGVGGPLTRTLQHIGKLFNTSIITGVSASVLPEKGVTPSTYETRTKTKSPQKSLPWDTLSPMEDFSRRGSFGRTYSFTRCASFSHSNSFTKSGQST